MMEVVGTGMEEIELEGVKLEAMELDGMEAVVDAIE